MVFPVSEFTKPELYDGIENEAHPRLTVAVQLHCSLCREALPWTDDWIRFLPRDYEPDWRSHVFALMNSAADANLPPHVHAHVLNPRRNDQLCLFYPPVPLEIKGSGNRLVSACKYPFLDPTCDSTMPMVFVHVSCWRLARRIHRRLSLTTLYRLGQQTLRMFPSCATDAQTRECFDSTYLPVPTSADTDLARLFYRYSNLPTELRLSIQKHLSGSLVGSLLAASHTASSFIPLIDKDSALFRPIKRTFGLDAFQYSTTIWLCGSTISIFGNSYIHKVELALEPLQVGPHDLAIPLTLNTVRGMRFVQGLHGVSAIQFVYENGTSSPWLGDPSKGWHGSLRCRNIPRFLHAVHDDFKLVRMDFDYPGDADLSRWPSKVLWDTKPEIKNNHKFRIVDTIDGPGRLPHIPDWRLCRYLPLEEDDSYATGLSVSVDIGGLRGIRVHGKTTRTIGFVRNDARYFPLRPGEYISFVAVLTIERRSEDASPHPPHGGTFSIRTNLGRSATFGSMEWAVHRRACWTWVTPDDCGKVTGFVVDMMSMHQYIGAASFQVFSIGATYLTSKTPKNTTEKPRLSQRLYRTGSSGGKERRQYSAMASSFRHVQSIQVQRVCNQYVSMCVHRRNGALDMLGKWDPARTDTISEIYSSANGPLKSISFDYDKLSDISRIVQITINTSPALKHDFTWQVDDSRLLGWFSDWGNYVAECRECAVDMVPSKRYQVRQPEFI